MFWLIIYVLSAIISFVGFCWLSKKPPFYSTPDEEWLIVFVLISLVPIVNIIFMISIAVDANNFHNTYKEERRKDTQVMNKITVVKKESLKVHQLEHLRVCVDGNLIINLTTDAPSVANVDAITKVDRNGQINYEVEVK